MHSALQSPNMAATDLRDTRIVTQSGATTYSVSVRLPYKAEIDETKCKEFEVIRQNV